MKILDQLKEIITSDNLYINEDMSKRTTFRIGGKADAFINVTDITSLQKVIRLCNKEDVDYTVLGNGSNVLVGDKGYRGVILHMGKGLSYIHVEGQKIRAGGGTILAQIAAVALKEEFAGFEFAAGIPGTVGGACVMNAGAYGGEMKDVLESITVLDSTGEVKEILAADLDLGYRKSIIPKEGYIVLEVVLAFYMGEASDIKGKMDEYREARLSKQPLNYPSAGSTFKRPEGYFAGKLIDDVGMRGYKVGGAQVSELHCGFVINADNATATDVRQLMSDVQKKVWDEFQVELEAEVKFLGEFHHEDRIIAEIAEICSRYPQLEKAVLFGSRARGDHEERSDYDIALYMSNEDDYKILDEIDDIETLLKIDVSIVRKNHGLSELFIENIEHEGVLIYG